MKPDILVAGDDLLTVMLNGLGVGVFLAVLMGCLLRWFVRTNAATRHALWFVTLLWVVAIIPAQWWLWPTHSSSSQSAASRNEALIVPGRSFDALPEAHERLVNSRDTEAVAAEEFVLQYAREELPDNPPSQAQMAPTGLPPAAPATASLTAKRPPWHFDLRSILPPGTGMVLVAGWIVVTGIKLIRLLFHLRFLRALKERSRPARSELIELFERLKTEITLSRPVDLRITSQERSAIVLGFFHPVVLFPDTADQSVDLGEVEQVLRHELAHVRRYDDWLNLAQQIIQSLLFFHPAVWWIAKRLALEREIACDDAVLRQVGRAQSYALLLVNLAGRGKEPQPLMVPGMSTGRWQLQQRIAMILNAHRNSSPSLAKAQFGILTTATALAAVLILYAAPKFVMAQDALPAVIPEIPQAADLGPVGASLDRAIPPNRLPPPALGLGLAQADSKEAAPSDNGGAEPKAQLALPAEDALPQRPLPPRSPGRPRPAMAPRAMPVPAPAPPGANMEERLDRLERMVQALADQQGGRRERFEFNPRELPRFDGFGDQDELNNFKGDVKREAARAAEMEKRALKQNERALKMEEKFRQRGPLPEGMKQQLEALHQQRDTLMREMEKLQRQIQQIEREHARLDERKHRSAAEDEEETEQPEFKRQ